MGEFEGTNFTIIDPADKKTMAFAIEKAEEDVFSLQKLDCSIENEGGKFKKTFFYNDPLPEGTSKDLVLLTVGGGKAVLNTAILEKNKLFISKTPSQVGYKMIYSDHPSEYTDIKYTPNFKRPISIVDPEIADEVRPVLYYDNEANAVKAKIKLLPNKSYIALEVR